MKIFTKGLIAAAGMLGLMATIPQAEALPFMSGSISISGNSLTVPAASGSIVSLLNSFVASSASAGGGTGSFIGCAVSCATTIPNFNITGLPSTMFTFTTGGDTFTINLQSATTVVRTAFVTGGELLSDSVSFNASGEISDSLNLFDSTAFSGNFTANGSCTSVNGLICAGTPTSSYSASLSALERAVTTPEPTSIALIGAGMLGLGAFRRRRG